MKINSILIRRDDNKQFKVIELGHWSTIQADDGELDYVKVYGADGISYLYVSNSKGFSYKFTPLG